MLTEKAEVAMIVLKCRRCLHIFVRHFGPSRLYVVYTLHGSHEQTAWVPPESSEHVSTNAQW